MTLLSYHKHLFRNNNSKNKNLEREIKMITNINYKNTNSNKEEYGKNGILWALDKYYNGIHKDDLNGFDPVNPNTLFGIYQVRAWNDPQDELCALTYLMKAYGQGIIGKDKVDEILFSNGCDTTADILKAFKENRIDIYDIHDFFTNIFTDDETFYLDIKDVEKDYPGMDEVEILEDYFEMCWHDVIVIPETNSLVMFS